MEEWRDEFDRVADNVRQVREQIAEAAVRANRDPSEITLLAATKTVPASVINRAVPCGIDRIGENRVQELLSKKDELELEGTPVDLIGHLQTNKVAKVLPFVSMIHSVDSLHLAQTISEQSLRLQKKTQVLVEVNIGGEECKSGVAPDRLEELLTQMASLPGISVRGLMTIPPICASNAEVGKYFSNMYHLFLDIRGKNIDNITMQHLSMGMSADFTEAIQYGATIVRVGSVLFGSRNTH